MCLYLPYKVKGERVIVSIKQGLLYYKVWPDKHTGSFSLIIINLFEFEPSIRQG